MVYNLVVAFAPSLDACLSLHNNLIPRPLLGVLLGLGTRLAYTIAVGINLVPRLPRSRTQTLKLCRYGQPGVFCHAELMVERR